MSTVAINAALTASSAANNASAQAAGHRARVDRCVIFESRFDVARASVSEKQEYASCVETLYPQPTSTEETWIIKSCIVILFLSVIIGAVVGYREFRDGGGILMGLILGLCVGLGGLFFIGSAIYGIAYLFS